MSQKEYFEGIISQDNKIKDLSTNNSSFRISVKTESRVPVEKKSCDIDILIEIFKTENMTQELLYAICVENKIKSNAASEAQLRNEIFGLMNKYSENKDDNPKLSLILLTDGNSEKSRDSFSKWRGKEEQLKSIPDCHLIWKKSQLKSDERSSIFDQLSSLLVRENSGHIEAIHEHTKYTIKSFLNFIKSDFRTYKEEIDRKRELISAINWDELETAKVPEKYKGNLKTAKKFYNSGYFKKFEELFQYYGCTIYPLCVSGPYTNIIKNDTESKIAILHIRQDWIEVCVRDFLNTSQTSYINLILTYNNESEVWKHIKNAIEEAIGNCYH
jgi:hypothetical protein